MGRLQEGAYRSRTRSHIFFPLLPAHTSAHTTCTYTYIPPSLSQTHKKLYAVEEEPQRYAAWLEGRTFVEGHNRLLGRSWDAGLNEYSDLSWGEFKAKMLMAEQNCSATHKSSNIQYPDAELPKAIDWRDHGALNAVKNQGHCGSCWTFSSTGSMEAHHYLKYGMMKNLSEQQLVDCAGAFNNMGCNGGLPSQAFEYLMYAGGHTNETTYKYTAVTGKKCLFHKSEAVAKVKAVNNITALDEMELKRAVGLVGPVSIAFQVAKDFRYYKKGVYDGTCDTGPADVNHAVVAVGYGKDHAHDKEYWTVRNSWGTSWGQAGYFKIAYGKNKCGLSDCAAYPTPA